MKFIPHDYQQYAIEYIETHEVAAVLLDMGLGKTALALTALYDLLFDLVWAEDPFDVSAWLNKYVERRYGG